MKFRSTEEICREFLVNTLGADRIPHGDRSLYVHLSGTYTLLRDWGNPPDVCFAGLFHSIYGTARFRTRTLPINKRRKLRNIIGTGAETLAYLFCVTDRPAGLISQWGKTDIVVVDRYLLDLVVLNRQELLWLLEIEAANLIDQNEGHGGHLDELAAIPLSAGARHALVSHPKSRRAGLPAFSAACRSISESSCR